MLDRLRNQLMAMQENHEELVKKYDEMVAQKSSIESELMKIEKQIIHNQGAMEAINNLGLELMEEEQTEVTSVPEEAVEIVQ